VSATSTPPPLPAPAIVQGAATTGYFVTFVARWCSQYTDIMANGARNNLQESLRDLGIDSQYPSGAAISPTVEAQFNPACRPIPPGANNNPKGWTFQLGGAIASQKVDYLSVVTNLTRSVTTLATNGSNPDGSVTIELTSSELSLAQNHNLWIQGGLPTDPLNKADFQTLYGFGALRCALDNVNGDNVEWVGFPSGVKSVYCYYYAVSPAPGYGSINVTKKVTNSTDTTTAFPFHGTLSFNNTPVQGYFSLKANQSMSFARASGSTWEMTEDVPGGWKIVSYTCTSTNGKSTYSAPPNQPGKLVVNLGDLDTVNCTYTDTPASFTIDKKTSGGVGGPFTLQVTPQSGTPPGPISVTTTIDGLPVRVFQDTPTASMQYMVTETGIPTGWSLTNVTCTDSQNLKWTPGSTAFTVTRQSGSTQACTITNTLNATGALTITKATQGGTGGPFTFIVVRDGDTAQRPVSATTTAIGAPITATGSDLSKLEPGDYIITEYPPYVSGAVWMPTSVTCNGSPPATAGTGVRVSVVAGQPMRCDFVDMLTQFGTLAINKVTSPSPDLTNSTFPFTVDGGPSAPPSGAATLPQNVTLSDGQTTTFKLGPASTYSVTEAVPAGWSLSNAVCDNGSGTPGGTGLTNITVSLGATVTCTFTDQALSPTATPTNTATASPTATTTPTACVPTTPTTTPTSTTTPSVTPTWTMTATTTPSSTLTATITATPSSTPTQSGTIATATPTPSGTLATSTATPTPSGTTAAATATPTSSATNATATTTGTPTSTPTGATGGAGGGGASASTPTATPTATLAPPAVAGVTVGGPQPPAAPPVEVPGGTAPGPPSTGGAPVPPAPPPVEVAGVTVPAPTPGPHTADQIPVLDSVVDRLEERLSNQPGAPAQLPAPPVQLPPIADGIYNLVIGAFGQQVQPLPAAPDPCASPEIALSSTQDTITAQSGDSVNLAFSVTNTGSVDVTDLNVASALPSGLIYESASGAGAVSADTGYVEWSLTGGLAAGDSTVFSVSATVAEPGTWTTNTCSAGADVTGAIAKDCASSTVLAAGLTPTPTATATITPTTTTTTTATLTPGTPTTTLTATGTATLAPSGTPTVVASGTPTVVASGTPTVVASDTPTVLVTDTPTVVATDTPVPAPTDTPTAVPTDTPTVVPPDTPTPPPADTPTPPPAPTEPPAPQPTSPPAPAPTGPSP
jgi:hypothetical protein